MKFYEIHFRFKNSAVEWFMTVRAEIQIRDANHFSAYENRISCTLILHETFQSTANTILFMRISEILSAESSLKANSELCVHRSNCTIKCRDTRHDRFFLLSAVSKSAARGRPRNCEMT